MTKEKCSERGCSSRRVKKGLCWKHYHEKYGKPPYVYGKAKEKEKRDDKKAEIRGAYFGATVSIGKPIISRGQYSSEIHDFLLDIDTLPPGEAATLKFKDSKLAEQYAARIRAYISTNKLKSKYSIVRSTNLVSVYLDQEK
jgi:hypothetical protein